jgi:G2/mitotic-specific cyclin-B, other
MLMMLDFNIVNPSSYRFLERFSKIAGLNSKQFNLARYLIELPLIEYRMLKYIPSNLAASAVYLTLKILPKQDENNQEVKVPAWEDKMQEHTGFTENNLKPCAKDLCILLQGIEKCSLQAVRKKFSHPAFNEVALIRLEH